MSQAFRYSMKGDKSFPSKMCVCKLWFGERYLIRKFKALHQGIKSQAVDIDRKLRNGIKEGDIHAKVIAYINRARIIKFEAEVIEMPDSAAKLLLAERRLLHEAANDPKCLNVHFDVETPKWITQSDLAAFNSLKEGLQVGQVVSSARGAGAFRVKSLKTAPSDGNTQNA